jgi:hypothetical protein
MIEMQTLAKLIPQISTVICLDSTLKNGGFGWNDAMRNMVNVPLVVNSVWPDRIEILLDGDSCTYSPNVLTLLEIKPIPFEAGNPLENTPKENPSVSIRGIDFFCVDKIEARFFSDYCTYKDYEIMRTILEDKKYLQLNKETLTTILEKCPRVLGALISNKKITRV